MKVLSVFPTVLRRALALGVLLAGLSACRVYHDTTSRFNAWFLADERLKEVELALFQNQLRRDNFNEVLQVYGKIDTTTAAALKPNLEYVIEKASIPIKLHESSKWVDDCYLLIGKARLYGGDFRNALTTFKYVNTKSPDINARQTALVWLLRTFVEQGDDKNVKYVADYIAKQEYPINDANARDFYLTMAHYYRLKNDYTRTVSYVEKAIPFIDYKEMRIRAMFIAANIFQQKGDNMRAYEYFAQVQRSSPSYELLFLSQLNSARSVDMSDEASVKKKERDLQGLLSDFKNIEFRDKIFYELGIFENKRNETAKAIDYFEKSLLVGANNAGQKAYTYLRLGETYYEKRQAYEKASLYYDSALLLLNDQAPNYAAIQARGEALKSFSQEMASVKSADRLLKLSTLSAAEAERLVDQEITAEVKAVDQAIADERRKAVENAKLLQDMARVQATSSFGGQMGGMGMGGNQMGGMGMGGNQMGGMGMGGNQMGGMGMGGNQMGGMGMGGNQMGGNQMGGMGMPGGQMGGGMGMPGGQMNQGVPGGNPLNNPGGGAFGGTSGGGNFYFYNAQVVQMGRQNFARVWGNFPLEDNWRRSDRPRDFNSQPDPTVANQANPAGGGNPGGQPVNQPQQAQIDARYLAIADKESRLAEIPTTPEKVASTKQSLEKSLMETGKLYYQVLKENPKAVEQLERLVREFPQSQLVPEALYTLARACREVQGCDPEKYKSQLLAQYPKSPYSRLVGAGQAPGADSTAQAGAQAIELIASAADTTVSRAYGQAYLNYQAGQYQQAMTSLDELMLAYPNTVYLDKITIVKALCLLKLDPASPQIDTLLKEFSEKFAQSELLSFAEHLRKTLEERRKTGQ
jgi:tetratricopeptide (TPR) repeat protein